ncbi:DUF3127 domain-containing protein [uncultured Chryseobacterium sp.]|uniref:DUF3127 domain-containing protein n=1 Tax=uncultured Chryseobacterium sp. TaxID=259322 RepID=UPI0025CE1D50|nr:DUF3127 domain-containing protein [uncultured Chryseobacterium sp.]
MELTGSVKRVGNVETFTSGFQKRELIILTQEQYPQPISIEFLSDKISLLDNVLPGQVIKVGINIRGREWTSPQGDVKCFNSIVGWRIEKQAATQQNAEPQTQTQAPPPAAESRENPFSGDDDDLPF